MTSKYEILFGSHATKTPCITPGGGGTQQSSIKGGSAPRSNPLPFDNVNKSVNRCRQDRL